MERAQLEELLYQSLETERGGVKIYEKAVQCAKNDVLPPPEEKKHTKSAIGAERAKQAREEML